MALYHIFKNVIGNITFLQKKCNNKYKFNKMVYVKDIVLIIL